MCLSFLRAAVLATVLVLVPAKTGLGESSFVETPVLVVSLAQSLSPSQSVDRRSSRERAATPSTLGPVDAPNATVPSRFGEERRFVRVFRRFVSECSWLC